MLTILGVMALAAAAAPADDTWTGASTALGNAKFLWSDPTNWSAGVPTSPARTLTFPDLGACTGACYTSSNNLGPISAAGLVLGNTTANTHYKIQGNPVAVGGGGIRNNSGHATGNLIQAPLILSTDQRWIVGEGFGRRGYNSLSVTGAVSAAVAAAPSALAVPFVAGSGNGSSGDLFVTADMEVGQVTVTGSGALHIGSPSGGASVNGTNGNPVAINLGATLIANPNSKVGALSVGAGGTGGELLLGTGLTNVGAVTLAAENGISPNAVSLNPSSSTQTYINGNGSTPGTDFSQLTASGPVALGGQLILAHGRRGSACAALGHHDVATLIAATGRLTGRFANASTNGAIIPMATVASSCAAPPLVRINYTANSVTATVVSATTPTTTTLAIPSSSQVASNQPVTLTATVKTKTRRNLAPAGAVKFTSGGTRIPGCAARPLTSSAGSNETATCRTSFLAAGSPESLRAAFTGTTSSRRGSSISAPKILIVVKNTGRLLGPAGRLSVSGRTVAVPVKCQSGMTCVGQVSLTTTTRAVKTGKLVPLGCAESNFRIRAHRTGNVRARLSAACAKLLMAARHHRLTVMYIARSRAGQRGQRKAITLVGT